VSLLSFSGSIRQRILFSSFIVLILFALSSAYSLQQFSSSTTSFIELEAVSLEAELIMEINADLAELQLDILYYSAANHQSAANRIDSSLAKLGADLLDISAGVTDETRSKTIQQMLLSYSNYEANIAAMRDSRGQEKELTAKQLPALSARMFENLKIGRNNARVEKNTALLNGIQMIQENLLESEIHMISFQVYRKHENQLQALQYLEDTGRLLEDVINNVPMSTKSESLLVLLQKNISDYETLFRRTIQAIRGSLFLVNVVMAGEAEEFSILASELKRSTLEFQTTLAKSANSQSATAQTATTSVTLIAILLGVALSISLSQSILSPIKEISLVFQRLSRGDVDGEIPGLERDDEIGVLATSATVFRNISLRTKILLEESEKLTSDLQIRKKELQIKTIELEKSIDQLDNFAYVASHDLKSPLRAVDNLATWIVEDCADVLPPTSAKHLDLLQQRISLMEKLLDDLLRYSRAGKAEEQLEEISMHAFIEEVTLLSDIPENFDLKYPETDIHLNTLAVSLRQVFLNLISNARKHGNSEHGIITVNWHDNGGDNIIFTVADNGPGIDPKYHDKIFQMFQTLNPKDIYDGSGMGLAIVRKLVDGVGGTISVESEEGSGAKFIFTWPKKYSQLKSH
tara:strand:+ start:28288 stop:30189 length:1902 start_codon:yes stop_codon:yes gene_type:complete